LQAQFSKNIILLLVINLLIKPIYILGIDAQVQNQVGPSEYGLYFALFNFCFLFQIILDFGIQNYNSKYVSENRDLVVQHFPSVLGTKLMLILAFVSVVSVAGFYTGYTTQHFQMLILLALVMVLQTMYNYFRSHFSALGFFRRETYLSALDKLLMIGIIGYWIYVADQINIMLFIYGQLAALLIANVIVVLLLKGNFQLSVSFSFQKSKALLKKTFPFALVFLLMTLYTRMDGVMLEAMLDDNAESAGIYAAGFRLLDAGNMLGYLFALLLLPMFAHILKKKDEVLGLVKSSFGLLISISTLIVTVCWFYGSEIIYLIYPAATEEYVDVFKILMISFWAMSASYVFGSLITASGKLKIFNWIFVIGIIINWSLNLLLIPKQGALGAAIATLITQFFVFIAQVTLANKLFSLSYAMDYILKCFLIVGTYFAISYLINTQLTIYWMVEIIIIAVFSVVISFFIGFFRLSLSQSEE